MINIYHKQDFDLISLDIWNEIEFFMSVHPAHVLIRVCVCDKYYKNNKINEEQIVSELLWILSHKNESPLMTYNFYFKEKWVCLQFDLDIMEYIYCLEEETLEN